VKNSVSSLNFASSSLASPELVSFVLREFVGLKSLCVYGCPLVTTDDLYAALAEYEDSRSLFQI
jgi:hypothetical protein